MIGSADKTLHTHKHPKKSGEALGGATRKNKYNQATAGLMSLSAMKSQRLIQIDNKTQCEFTDLALCETSVVAIVRYVFFKREKIKCPVYVAEYENRAYGTNTNDHKKSD